VATHAIEVTEKMIVFTRICCGGLAREPTRLWLLTRATPLRRCDGLGLRWTGCWWCCYHELKAFLGSR
jgi:hypothetical protein